MNIQEENSAHYFRVQSEREQTLDSGGTRWWSRITPGGLQFSENLFEHESSPG